MLIPVCFIYDKNFIMPTSVAITSMLENRKEDTFYDIFLIGVDCENEDLSCLEAFRNEKNVDIHFRNADMSAYESISQVSHVSQASLVKFNLPQLVTEYDKLLYIDGDVLIMQDLTEFYEEDLTGYYLGGPQNTVDIVRGKGQFLTGAYVYDSKKMIEDDIPQKLIDYRVSLGNRKSMDNTTFNEYLGAGFKKMPIKFDLPIRKLIYERMYYKVADLNKFYGTNYKTHKDIVEDAVVIHFDGAAKPWKYSCFLYDDVWYEYYKKSPCKDLPLKRKTYWDYLGEQIDKSGIKGLYYVFKDWVRESLGEIKSVRYVEGDWN